MFLIYIVHCCTRHFLCLNTRNNKFLISLVVPYIWLCILPMLDYCSTVHWSLFSHTGVSSTTFAQSSETELVIYITLLLFMLSQTTEVPSKKGHNSALCGRFFCIILILDLFVHHKHGSSFSCSHLVVLVLCMLPVI